MSSAPHCISNYSCIWYIYYRQNFCILNVNCSFYFGSVAIHWFCCALSVSLLLRCCLDSRHVSLKCYLYTVHIICLLCISHQHHMKTCSTKKMKKCKMWKQSNNIWFSTFLTDDLMFHFGQFINNGHSTFVSFTAMQAWIYKNKNWKKYRTKLRSLKFEWQ